MYSYILIYYTTIILFTTCLIWSIHPSVHLLIYQLVLYTFINSPRNPFILPSVFPFIHSSIYPLQYSWVMYAENITQNHLFLFPIHFVIPFSIFSGCLSINHPFIRSQSIHPSIHPSIHLSAHLSAHPSIHPSIHPFILYSVISYVHVHMFGVNIPYCLAFIFFFFSDIVFWQV